jgi:two-component system response regulator ChvI
VAADDCVLAGSIGDFLSAEAKCFLFKFDEFDKLRGGVVNMTANLGEDIASLAAAEPALLASVSKADAIRVLLIEDDPICREALADKLSKQGFAVQSYGDGTSLLGALDAGVDADVIVLHWDLPKTSGIDLLVILRQQGVNVPVVLLSDQALRADECPAFDRGAINFIGKSRGAEVQVRCLKTVIKASKGMDEPQSDKAVICGKLLLHLDVSRAYWNDVDVGLTLGEYNIVHLLASNVGRYVTYRAVYDRLHYEGFLAGTGPEGYRANVRSAIKRIRNKFRDLDSTFDKIENHTGFGYCWRKPA